MQTSGVSQESPHGRRAVAEIESVTFHSSCLELQGTRNQRGPTCRVSAATYLLSRRRIGSNGLDVLLRDRDGIDSNSLPAVDEMLLIVELVQQPIVILILRDKSL